MTKTLSKQAVAQLRSVPFFAGCTDKELAHLDHLSDVVTVGEGHEIVRQGSFGAEVYIVLKGSASVSMNGELVAELGEGALFGEYAHLDHKPRSATVTSRSETTLLVFGSREFGEALDSVPTFSRKVLANLSLRLRGLNHDERQ